MIDRAAFTNWRKSLRSGGGDNCVEVAFAPDGTIGVRDSKDPNGAILAFETAAWGSFIEGVQGKRPDQWH